MRAFFIELAFFSTPFFFYLLWTYILKINGKKVQKHPVLWLCVAGLLAMVFGVAVVGYMDRAPAGSAYEPPRLENGIIVPGTFR
jgi:Family of unknown function (DUF6111)